MARRLENDESELNRTSSFSLGVSEVSREDESVADRKKVVKCDNQPDAWYDSIYKLLFDDVPQSLHVLASL